MKQAKIVLVLNLFLCFSALGLDTKDSLKHFSINNLVIGFNNDIRYSNSIDPATDKKYIDFSYRFEPEISIYSNFNIGLGLKGLYHHRKSNYTTYPQLYGIGGLIRYYYPIKLKNEELKNLFTAFIELNYLRTNFYFNSSEENPIHTKNFDANWISIPIGLDIRIWKGLHGKINLRPSFFNPGGNFLIYDLGFEYHIKL